MEILALLKDLRVARGILFPIENEKKKSTSILMYILCDNITLKCFRCYVYFIISAVSTLSIKISCHVTRVI